MNDILAVTIYLGGKLDKNKVSTLIRILNDYDCHASSNANLEDAVKAGQESYCCNGLEAFQVEDGFMQELHVLGLDSKICLPGRLAWWYASLPFPESWLPCSYDGEVPYASVEMLEEARDNNTVSSLIDEMKRAGRIATFQIV
jgi:hypothetical protein